MILMIESGNVGGIRVPLHSFTAAYGVLGAKWNPTMFVWASLAAFTKNMDGEN